MKFIFLILLYIYTNFFCFFLLAYFDIFYAIYVKNVNEFDDRIVIY